MLPDTVRYRADLPGEPLLRLRGREIKVLARNGPWRPPAYDILGVNIYVGTSSTTGPKVSGGRVAAGAILLGPLGALGGALLQRSATTVNLVLEFADGTVVIKPYDTKDQPAIDKFVSKVRRAEAAFAPATA